MKVLSSGPIRNTSTFARALTFDEARRAIAFAYTEGVREFGLILPHVPNWADPAWHLYVVRANDRDGLQKRLTEAGVGTLIHYPIPLHMQAAYAALGLASRCAAAGPAVSRRGPEAADGAAMPLIDVGRVTAVVRMTTP